MDTSDGKKIWNDATKDNSLAYRRIDESRKMVAKVINTLEAVVDKVKWACESAEWNDDVAYQISEAAEKLGYALATLTTWDGEDDQLTDA